MHLTASLYSEGSPQPARIRRMSAGEALIEASVLPDVGTLVQLVRGKLIAHAMIVWVEAGQCGLKFCGLVQVDQWRATPRNLEQQRVDEVLDLVKAGAELPGVSEAFGAAREEAEDAADTLSDLYRITSLLHALETALARDAIIVANYGTALQNLDIAMQLLDATASNLSSCSRPPHSIAGLRRSADQALQNQRA